MQEMEFLFSQRLMRAVHALPGFYKRFYWLLLPLFLLQTCVAVLFYGHYNIIIATIAALVCLLLWCAAIDAVDRFYDAKRWSLSACCKPVFKGFFCICLLLLMFAIAAYLFNFVFGWVLILAHHAGVSNKLIASFIAIVFIGFPFLYMVVNMLMTPYNFIVRGDRFFTAIKYSMQLVLPYWIAAAIIYVLFLMVVLLFGPETVWLKSRVEPPLLWVISFVFFAVLYPVLLLLWYDFVIFIQEALKDRLRKAKNKQS